MASNFKHRGGPRTPLIATLPLRAFLPLVALTLLIIAAGVLR